MNRLGVVLLWLGALLGILVGAGMGIVHFSPIALHGVSWWVALAATKLALVASGGLMTAGAVMLRLGRRDDARALAAGADADDDPHLTPPGA
jgi:hypothetical protein